ncbi:ATPase, T2SS/T4P/T4SS family [Lacticaseibacillus zhaodongensis]|uniref:ATPase, T2SS/T4P/T4SS family n=1 Tax=Lacticaseibacillus zhaodongensis TaxID=2668065 RepID=UPI0018AFBC75|nr:ATPase, T2SS/T4P/T4SS family [Lacticaseibacillus zhaodongensis]
MDIERIIELALADGASDVYLLPSGDRYRQLVRTPRGVECIRADIDAETAAVWINLLKYKAGMNLSEHRRVQQGAVWLDSAGCFLRLSSAGDYQNHESLVIRIIDSVPAVNPNSEDVIAQLLDLATHKGLLAVCGPTGAGKTTLMYQLAQRLAQDRVVMTIEDPVEIAEQGFLQLQVNVAAGMTYASLLKASLRHRPDVVIIGELRDEETARAACEAALAGHIVMATVHTRSPEDVPLRLISLGVPPELVHGALRVSAQVQLHVAAAIEPLVEIWQWNNGEGELLTPRLWEQEVAAGAE